MYEFLMEIGFIFKDGEKGKRIVGGADSKYSCENLNWLNFKGKNVMIRTKKGFIYLKVKKIDIFPSIAGALNIGLTLYDNEKFDLLNIGHQFTTFLKIKIQTHVLYCIIKASNQNHTKRDEFVSTAYYT